jgi:hypothetical protein
MSWRDIIKIEPFEEAVAEEYASEDIEEGRKQKAEKRHKKDVESAKAWLKQRQPIFEERVKENPNDAGILETINRLAEMVEEKPNQVMGAIRAVTRPWDIPMTIRRE